MNNYDLIFNNDNSSEHNKILDDYFIEGEDESIEYLPNTNLINIIIGSNNSGKSRFMRYIMSCKNLKGVRNFTQFESDVEIYNDIVDSFNKIAITDKIESLRVSLNHYYNQADRNSVNERINFLNSKKLTKLDKSNITNISNQIEENKKSVIEIDHKGGASSFLKNFSSIDDKTVIDFTNVKNYYIPTLRTAHSLFLEEKEDIYKKIESDIYLTTLNKYYNLDESIEIFTGLHLYKDILNSRNSKRSVRESFEKFEKFIGESFFNGKQVDIVAEFNKDESLADRNDSEIISIHIEGERETRKLYEMGDGIQAIIILLYKIFMADNDSFIFIDEPELNLHPGMQRLFLDQISSNEYLKSKNLRYFISTHSNHFLDLSIEKEDISIFSFYSRPNENEKQFTIRNVNAGNNSILKNLGVNNSSVFIANSSIWVEGISDRNYIKAFLNSYIESLGDKSKLLREDIDYAFFEYAGSNIEHYIFDDNYQRDPEQIIDNINSLALHNRIFLLADSDVASKSSKKGKRLVSFEKLKRDNFKPYIIWSHREIENLLPTEVWNESLIHLCNKKIVDKDEESVQNKIESSLNDINAETYAKKYIGEFLNEVSVSLGKIGKTNILNHSNYITNSDSFGTLTNKRYLSEIVLEKKFPWSTFKKNKEIKKLTESIYQFILEKS